MNVELPEYNNEIVVEMYLEDNRELKCIVSEAQPYSSTLINRLIDNAQVVFSNGSESDTLQPVFLYYYESGRKYNYAAARVFKGDSTKTYSLKIIDSLNREITASTKIPSSPVKIDKISFNPSTEKPGWYSVGFSFADPAEATNYYRVIIGNGIDNYNGSNTDFLLNDDGFNGKTYAFNSEAGYSKYDTVTVRLYSLLKEHYNFLQLTESARTANFNPFMQPVEVKTNIIGGQGIFTAIRYDEKGIVIN
jgi:hypothetical protein